MSVPNLGDKLDIDSIFLLVELGAERGMQLIEGFNGQT